MIRACSRSRLRNPQQFTPLNLFSTGEQGAWFDPSDITTLFQDDAGTVPVTADGQTVGRMLDKSGRGNLAVQTVAGSRPTYRASGGLAWLEFDGVDDFMVTGTIDLTATDKATVFAGVRKNLDTPTGIFVEMSADGSVNNGTFAITAPTSAVPGAYGLNLRGTALIARAASVFTAPITNVVTGAFNLAGADFNTEILARVNGQVPTLSGAGAAGAGNLGNFQMFIGRRGGATLPFNGNLYGLIVRGAFSDSASVFNAESYMALKSGITF